MREGKKSIVSITEKLKIILPAFYLRKLALLVKLERMYLKHKAKMICMLPVFKFFGGMKVIPFSSLSFCIVQVKRLYT